MPVHAARAAGATYGEPIGVLLLDYRGPLVPGDVGNASSFDHPVIFKTVPGTDYRRVFVGDPELNDPIVTAAKELVAEGAVGITTDCGFFVQYQDVVQSQVDVPVLLSSLLQIPLIEAMCGPDRSIGVVTVDKRALTPRVLACAGATDARLVIRGMQDQRNFWWSVIEGGEYLDTELVAEEVAAVAKKVQEDDPSIAAIVLECSMLPPYARAVQERVDLPVFDFITLTSFLHDLAQTRRWDN